MPTKTSSVSPADLEAVKDFPRRMAAAVAELEAMRELAERLDQAGYPGADEILSCLGDGSQAHAGFDSAASWRTHFSRAVRGCLAADGDEGSWLFEHLIINRGLSLAGAEAELWEYGDGARQIEILKAVAATQSLPAGADSPATTSEALTIARGRLNALLDDESEATDEDVEAIRERSLELIEAIKAEKAVLHRLEEEARVEGRRSDDVRLWSRTREIEWAIHDAQRAADWLEGESPI